MQRRVDRHRHRRSLPTGCSASARVCGDHNLRGVAGESRACFSPTTTRAHTGGERGWMNFNICDRMSGSAGGRHQQRRHVRVLQCPTHATPNFLLLLSSVSTTRKTIFKKIKIKKCKVAKFRAESLGDNSRVQEGTQAPRACVHGRVKVAQDSKNGGNEPGSPVRRHESGTASE